MANRALKLLKSFVTCLCLAACVVVTTPLMLALLCLPATIRYRCRLIFGITALWSWIGLRTSLLRFEVHGQENIPDAKSILVMNHLSALDIPLVETLLLGRPRVWVSNDYGRVPILGQVLRRMHVVVSRVTARAAVGALATSAQLAHRYGSNILIFPEGTRHPDGQIHRFHSGFAVLAQQLDWPVVPIFIFGLHKVFPKGAWLIDSGASEVFVRIGPPLRAGRNESKEEFVVRVRDWFLQQRSVL